MEELQGDFILNKSGWFTVQNVAENEFLNSKLDSNKYGIWYSVKFTGNAETYLWQTKAEPVEGEKYWGWLEKTKSGKATKFKWDKQNAPTSDSGYKNASEVSNVAHTTHFDDKEDSIARAVALKGSVELYASIEKQDGRSYVDDILSVADTFLAWLKNENSGTQQATVPTAVPETSNAVLSTPAATTGYQKAKQVRDNLQQDPEVQSLMQFADGQEGDYEHDHTN